MRPPWLKFELAQQFKFSIKVFMTTEIQTKVIKLQRMIIDEQYYVQLWRGLLVARNISETMIGYHSDHELILLCQAMWEALPDSPDIRRHPFFQLCNIAEHIFNLRTPVSMQHLYLSRRNLRVLLSKLDRSDAGELTHCAIIKHKNLDYPFIQTMNEIMVHAIADEVYYTTRAPGEMHPADEPAGAIPAHLHQAEGDYPGTATQS